MQTELECLPCFTRQALDALNLVSDDHSKKWDLMREILQVTAQFNPSQLPPEMGQIIHRIIRKKTENSDPYAALKTLSTQTALRMESDVRTKINGAINPFLMAVRYAIAGNIMDYALTAKWRPIDQIDFIDETCRQVLDEVVIRQLEKAVHSAATILYLGDNAGETVFDRLLIEQFPAGKTIYAVKSAPIINDATFDDAIDAGLEKVATIVDNGTDAPGTLLEQCSPEFKSLFKNADLVISKGQANWETLNEVDREVFFLTRIKCPVIAKRIERPNGSWQVIHKQEINQ